jgi:hypothetical protein
MRIPNYKCGITRNTLRDTTSLMSIITGKRSSILVEGLFSDASDPLSCVIESREVIHSNISNSNILSLVSLRQNLRDMAYPRR